jgi:hypothetical protein
MFDPYHAWLGLPSRDTHSPAALLGVAADECDPRVLEDAALEQVARVRPYQHAFPRESTRLLNEIAQALTAVLNRVPRKPSDTQLKMKAATRPATATDDGSLRVTAFVMGAGGTDDVTAWRMKMRPIPLSKSQRRTVAAKFKKKPEAGRVRLQMVTDYRQREFSVPRAALEAFLKLFAR